MCYDVPTKIEKGRSAMFVLLDMEWIESRGGHRSLTQLYAARVDAKWNTIRAFDALVCPREPGTAPWEHLAFNGYAPAEFCASDSEKSCVQRFFRWLQPDDVICCWHVETKNTLKALYSRYLFGTFSTTVRCMNQKVYAAIKALRERAGFPRPRRSTNPATMLPSCRCCFRRLNSRSQKRPNARQPKNRSPDRSKTRKSLRHRAITTCTLQIPRSFTAEIASSFCA